jgi:hypothetical protein
VPNSRRSATVERTTRSALLSYQNDGRYFTADFRKAGEIVIEYSNAWIDIRHDNALISAEEPVQGARFKAAVAAVELETSLRSRLGRADGTGLGGSFVAQAMQCLAVKRITVVEVPDVPWLGSLDQPLPIAAGVSSPAVTKGRVETSSSSTEYYLRRWSWSSGSQAGLQGGEFGVGQAVLEEEAGHRQ